MQQTQAEKNPAIQQNITLIGRTYLTITGAEDVISFDETSIALQTSLGVLSIDGTGLKIKRLSTETQDGSIQIEGTVNGMFYIDDSTSSSRRGLFGRRK